MYSSKKTKLANSLHADETDGTRRRGAIAILGKSVPACTCPRRYARPYLSLFSQFWFKECVPMPEKRIFDRVIPAIDETKDSSRSCEQMEGSSFGRAFATKSPDYLLSFLLASRKGSITASTHFLWGVIQRLPAPLKRLNTCHVAKVQWPSS